MYIYVYIYAGLYATYMYTDIHILHICIHTLFIYVYRSDKPAARPLGLAACRGCEDLQLVARGSQLHIRIHTYCKHVYIPTYTDLHILHLRIHTHIYSIYVYTPTADTHTDSLRLALLDLMPVAVARIDNWWHEVLHERI